jgi:Condensation domain
MYNMPECARLRGPLDPAVFQRGFDDVVARHESLRVTFEDGPDGPIQKVRPQLSIPIDHIDLEHCPPSVQEDEAMAMLFRVADQPFDLIRGPVVRLTLIRLSDDDHFMVINMHHIVSDGWSMAVFAEDFGRALAARARGEAPALPPLPIHFGDFVEWQLDRLTGPVLQSQLDFWRPRLDVVEDIVLPFDRTPTETTSDAGGFEYIVLDPVLSRQLKACAEASGGTLFMFLFAVFSVLLHRYSGQRHITMGSPTAGRMRQETEPLIGFFANTLLITARIRPEDTIFDVAATVRDSATGAFAHDETPLELLVEALKPQRSLARNPLFQVMFILQNSRRPQLELSGFDVSLIAAGSMSVKFDMLIEFYEKDGGITGWLGYRTDLFDATTISRLAQNFATLARAIVASPQTPVGQLGFDAGGVSDAFNDDLDDAF